MLFSADIHLYREYLYWFIAEVGMCDCLDFISVIRDVNSTAGIVALRISLCDNQTVILAEHNSLNQLAKDLEIMFENYVEGFEAACVVSRNAKKFRPGDTAMQRAGDVLYRPQHYHMNIEEGLDLSSKTPTALVQRLVPSVFKEPKNILYTLDAREMRDPEHKTEAGRAAGMRLAAQIDSDLISMVTQRATNVITMADSTTGSQGRDLWNCAAGIDATMTAIGVPQGINRRSFWNPFNYKDLAGELGHRAYAQGATLTAYEKAQIPPVASFDSYKTDISGRVPKGTATSLTLAAEPAHKVEAKDANDMPVDNRQGTITVSVTIPTAPTNLVSLLKTLTPSSGTLAPFFDTVNNKMVVFNENKTLFFKLSIVGTWPSGTANRSMQLTFSGSVPDTLVSSRNAATTTDNILLATFFSVDKDGFLATNGSTLTIQSNGAAFTATTIKIIAEQ